MSRQKLFRTTSLALLTWGAASAIALPAAQAQAKLDRAEFDLTFTATQTTDWRTDDVQQEPCGGLVIQSKGAGRQTMKVTIKRTRVVVERVRSLGMIVTHIRPRGAKPDAIDPFRVDVAAERTGTLDSITISDQGTACADGGTGEAPPAPDCGPKALKGRLGLVPAIQRVGRGLGMAVHGPYMRGGFEHVVQEAYRNCPLIGPSALIEAPMTVISARKLFGRNPKLIARDEHALVEDAGPATRSTTKLAWRMVLVRRGGR